MYNSPEFFTKTTHTQTPIHALSYIQTKLLAH